jgi:hypothetical protein
VNKKVFALNEARRTAGHHDISQDDQAKAITEIIEELRPQRPPTYSQIYTPSGRDRSYKKNVPSRATEYIVEKLEQV